MTDDKGIFIRNIYYMLSYAFHDLRKNNYEDIAGEDFEGIHDLFAEIIARGVSFQLKQGLHRRYVRHAESLPVMRGKIDIARTIRLRSSARHLLGCEYDEYSEDNIFNRILKSTLLLLLKHSKVKQRRKNSIRKLLPFFAAVRTTDLKLVRWDALSFDRNSRTYQMLLYLCYFIVDEMLLTTERGEYRLHSFSDERMCRLFEKFVLEYYRSHHPELRPCARQIDWNIVEDESPAANILPVLQTDVYLTVGERTLIIDTKYYGRSMQSYFEKKTIHSGNLAQIFEYVVNLDSGHQGTTDGMLLYARTQEEIQPDGHVRLRDGNMLYFRNLDLNQDFEHIKRDLDLFVGNMR